MNLIMFSQLLAGLAMMFTLVAFSGLLWKFARLPRPADSSRLKGNPLAGVRYALTLGMAPWAKESTRRHWLAYLRGIAFHLGIFLGFGILFSSPWIPDLLPVVRASLAAAVGTGSLFGMAGFVSRFLDPNLRSLSTMDDYFSAFMVSLFQVTAAIFLLYPNASPIFYLVSAVMLVYAPFSKIRHCLYFAFSRIFFGRFIGSRGVLYHPKVDGGVQW